MLDPCRLALVGSTHVPRLLGGGGGATCDAEATPASVRRARASPRGHKTGEGGREGGWVDV